jgi:anti-anti-sigma regulatory factor
MYIWFWREIFVGFRYPRIPFWAIQRLILVLDLTLPSRLDLSAAGALLSQTIKIAEGEGDCCVNARDVLSVGTACLQILFALDRALAGRGRRLTLTEPSKAMVDGMTLLGMETILSRWIARS